MINTTINTIKKNKRFYVNAYRRELAMLLFFLVTQLVWVAMIVYVVIDYRDEVPVFYASSSDGNLTGLKPMVAPNQSDKPLLE